ncbi:hypothetical protein CVT24_012802 [Panaeolus cyanescens]|uniref:RNase III domain-containing protein n=1 Tax=Panaeolus cyanescens TaxID=181874 RepID=A0A409W2Q4_9AGAR|nr:hypothetical protein CVT24_012802 [Panaeolus cyanescens]
MALRLLSLQSTGISTHSHLVPRFFPPSARLSAKSSTSASLNLQSAPMSLKPDFGKDGALFPPLPEIKSTAIRLQVFTHRSYFARPTHVFEDHPDDLSPDNEKYPKISTLTLPPTYLRIPRLEHLGDTVLGMTITQLLMELYPGLRVGPSTKIRAMIVGNATLAEISLKYKLPDRLRLHPAQAITLRASTNIQADVFESFIGGLYLDQGLDVVRDWARKLFPPYAVAAYELTRQQHGLPPMPPSFGNGYPSSTFSCPPMAMARTSSSTGSLPSPVGGTQGTISGAYLLPEPGEIIYTTPTTGHLALFNQHLQKANRQIEWIYSDGSEAAFAANGGYADVGLPEGSVIRGTNTTPVWYVKVVVDGVYFGRGRGNTKKAARNEAAKEGLAKLGIMVW